jgi:hypothetical protein
LPRINGSATLEAAVKVLSDAGAQAALVTGPTGQPKGQVTLRNLMDAL